MLFGGLDVLGDEVLVDFGCGLVAACGEDVAKGTGT